MKIGSVVDLGPSAAKQHPWDKRFLPGKVDVVESNPGVDEAIFDKLMRIEIKLDTILREHEALRATNRELSAANKVFRASLHGQRIRAGKAAAKVKRGAG